MGRNSPAYLPGHPDCDDWHVLGGSAHRFLGPEVLMLCEATVWIQPDHLIAWEGRNVLYQADEP